MSVEIKKNNSFIFEQNNEKNSRISLLSFVVASSKTYFCFIDKQYIL